MEPSQKVTQFAARISELLNSLAFLLIARESHEAHIDLDQQREGALVALQEFLDFAAGLKADEVRGPPGFDFAGLEVEAHKLRRLLSAWQNTHVPVPNPMVDQVKRMLETLGMTPAQIMDVRAAAEADEDGEAV